MATIPPNLNVNQIDEDLNSIASKTEIVFRNLADNIKNVFAEAIEQGNSMSKSLGNDISNNLKSIARQSVTTLTNQNSLNQGLLKQSDIQKQILQRENKIQAIKSQIEATEEAGIALSSSVRTELDEVIRLNEIYIKQLEKQNEIIKTSADDVNTKLGLAPKLLSGLSHTLSKLGLPDLGFKEAMENVHKLRQAAEEAGEGESFSVWGTYTKEISKNLKGALTTANLLQIGVGLMVEAFFKLDTMAGDTAKAMGISYQTASQLNSEFNSIANNSGNMFVTTKGINESFNQINVALGTNAELSNEMLVTQTELTKQAFYSVEAATALSKLELATGKPAKEIATSFLGQAKALNLVNKTAINEKVLLESISKVSKGTLATFASQPGKLAEAAYQAKKVGLELDKIKGIQDSLLNIESSIASEFEAEILTGRQLNLERARYYALTNNIAGVSQELNKQGVTLLSFGKMNVIQQEATAKAMGMSRDEMGNMLMEQKAINALSGIDGKNSKEKYDNLVKQVGVQKAQEILGDETLAQQMESASIQDRFTASVEKLKEAFVGLMIPIMPILDAFSTLLGFISSTKIALIALQTVMTGLAVKSLVTAIASIFTGSAILGPVGLGIAAAATAGLMIAVNSAKQQVSDGTAPASKGPFTITDKFGATAITAAGDHIAVSPNLIKESAVSPNLIKGSQPAPTIKQPTQTQTIQNIQQVPQIDYDKMAQAMSRVQVQTNLDGVQVSNQIFNKPSAGMAIRKI